jgi:hypothetical protein
MMHARRAIRAAGVYKEGMTTSRGRLAMTLCPIALAAGCQKCPAFSVCPLKSVLGDYKKPEAPASKPGASGKKHTGSK